MLQTLGETRRPLCKMPFSPNVSKDIKSLIEGGFSSPCADSLGSHNDLFKSSTLSHILALSRNYLHLYKWHLRLPCTGVEQCSSCSYHPNDEAKPFHWIPRLAIVKSLDTSTSITCLLLQKNAYCQNPRAVTPCQGPILRPDKVCTSWDTGLHKLDILKSEDKSKTHTQGFPVSPQSQKQPLKSKEKNTANISPSQHQIRSLNWRLYGSIISLDIYYELLGSRVCRALCGSQTEPALWERINNTLSPSIHRIVAILCNQKFL